MLHKVAIALIGLSLVAVMCQALVPKGLTPWQDEMLAAVFLISNACAFILGLLLFRVDRKKSVVVMFAALTCILAGILIPAFMPGKGLGGP